MKLLFLIVAIVGFSIGCVSAFGWFGLHANVLGFDSGAAAFFAAAFLPLADRRVGP